MVDASGKVDFRWLEGIICREVDCEEEDTARIWAVTLHDHFLALYGSFAHFLVGIDGCAREVMGLERTGPMIVACQWNCGNIVCQQRMMCFVE